MPRIGAVIGSCPTGGRAPGAGLSAGAYYEPTLLVGAAGLAAAVALAAGVGAAKGKPVDPKAGKFIDMHTHSDLALVRDGVLDMKLAQGVTLEVLGHAGARALVAQPSVLVLDEPTTHLDDASIQRLMESLRNFISHRHSTPGKPKHENVRPMGILFQLLRKETARISSVVKPPHITPI